MTARDDWAPGVSDEYEDCGDHYAAEVAGEYTEPQDVLPCWAILELMGHRRLAGYLSEQEVAGAPMLRLDIPAGGDTPRLTQLYSSNAVYALTPTTEAIARAVAAQTVWAAPVSRYELEAAPTTRSCRVCRCTDEEGCEAGCEWITEDLCSTCAPDGECEVCHRPATQTIGRLKLCGVVDTEHSLAVDEDRRAALADV